MNEFPIRGTQNRRIDTAGQWRTIAPPRDPSQWVRFGAPAEFAKRWTTGTLEEIDALLQPLGEFVAEEGFAGLPSAIEDPRGKRAPIDLTVVGTAGGVRTLILVDGRGEAPYGNTVGEQLAKESARSSFSQGSDQIERMVRAIFGGPVDPARSLRFAILNLVAVALVEAGLRGCAQAVFVLHEMRGPMTSLPALGRNAADLDAFVRSLSHNAQPEAAPGKLVGPIVVPGEGRIPQDARLYLGRAIAELK